MFTAVGGAVFTVGGATQTVIDLMGPKDDKKSPRFDKIIVLIM